MSRETIVRERDFNPLIAGLLSFFIPGLGQLYKGQLLRAVLWFLVVPAGYLFFFVPGLVLHFFCVMGAVAGKGARTVVRVG